MSKMSSKVSKMTPKTRNTFIPPTTHPEILKEKIYSYDTNKYNFREVIQTIMELDCGEKIESLEDMHSQAGEVSATMYEKHLFKTKGESFRCSKQQVKWNLERDRRQAKIVEKYKEFDELFDKFMQEIVGPETMGGGRVLYQRAPTLRVYFPSDIATAFIHNDREYHHQPSEINFWLPITAVEDNNTLWLETEPNKGDFHPLRIGYGQYCRFYGNLCRHYTNPNDTNKTRISLDFRAVSPYSGEHDPNFDRGKQRGAKAKYLTYNDVGGYYNEIFTDLNEKALTGESTVENVSTTNSSETKTAEVVEAVQEGVISVQE